MMTATIQHETKKTYRVKYEIENELNGTCLARGTDIETAKKAFECRFKKYKIEWK